MLQIPLEDLPDFIQEMPSAPKQLFVRGDLKKLLKLPRVSIVGSRKVTQYGRSVTTKIAGDLARQGVVIVSGLALGVDALAHQAALDAGGLTIAVLPCGLGKIYPATNRQLAERILAGGGALISEYLPEALAFKQFFIARNRLVSAFGHGLLITEAAEKSGSLHTARFALEQGRDVMAVPGSITSEMSVGTNNLIRAGAVPITSTEDILQVLGLKSRLDKEKPVPKGSNVFEQLVIDLIVQGTYDGNELLLASELETAQFNQTLTMLEISGKIRPTGANQWALR